MILRVCVKCGDEFGTEVTLQVLCWQCVAEKKEYNNRIQEQQDMANE